MPRDDWDKAKIRAKFGPVRPKKKRGNGQATKLRKARRSLQRDLIAVSLCFSTSSKLWFGKYRDLKIGDVPREYLHWVVDSHVPNLYWRMDGLVLFLKRFLQTQPATAQQRDTAPIRQR